MSLPVWLPGPMFLLGGGSLSLVPCSFKGGLCLGEVSVQGDLCLGGISVPGEGVSVQKVSVQRPPIQRTVGNVHPTGMHSC